MGAAFSYGYSKDIFKSCRGRSVVTEYEKLEMVHPGDLYSPMCCGLDDKSNQLGGFRSSALQNLKSCVMGRRNKDLITFKKKFLCLSDIPITGVIERAKQKEASFRLKEAGELYEIALVRLNQLHGLLPTKEGSDMIDYEASEFILKNNTNLSSAYEMHDNKLLCHGSLDSDGIATTIPSLSRRSSTWYGSDFSLSFRKCNSFDGMDNENPNSVIRQSSNDSDDFKHEGDLQISDFTNSKPQACMEPTVFVYIELLNTIGENLLCQKKFREAIYMYNFCIYLSYAAHHIDDICTFYYKKGAVYHMILDYDTAEVCMQKALSIRPHYAPALFSLGTMKMNSRNSFNTEFDERSVIMAIEYFNRLLSVDRSSYNVSEIIILLANCYQNLKRYEEAMSFLHQARNLDSGNFRITKQIDQLRKLVES